MIKKILRIFGTMIAVTFIGLVGFVAWSMYPHDNPLPLPPTLVAATSAEGSERLANAEAFADYAPLADSFQAQSVISYCGVASSVAVLGAFGNPTTQADFFTDEASAVRSRFKVTFGGMSLPNLVGLLNAHGLTSSAHYADQFSVAEFRASVEKNLATDNDYLLVNYQREALGQARVGHISPLAAYDRETDSVLIMDTAAHKYPPTWVPIELLYAGMNTTDPASGKRRGYLEVTQ
jgi:hypothetical protein